MTLPVWMSHALHSCIFCDEYETRFSDYMSDESAVQERVSVGGKRSVFTRHHAPQIKRPLLVLFLPKPAILSLVHNALQAPRRGPEERF